MGNEKAQGIFDLMLAGADFTDQTEVELWNEIRTYALAYVDMRSLWVILNREEKVEKDARRTSCHNMFMSALRVYQRYLDGKGKGTLWANWLFQEELGRKYVGDFAGYFLLCSSLKER